MNKAVFLDRDGVINNDEGLYYIYKPSDLKLNTNIAENIAKINRQGYLVIVVSNQGGIGKGLYSKHDTDIINQFIEKEIENKGAKIDAFYYCPHHPDTGNCYCRKPNSLLIEKAMARFDINKGQSYLIGDSPRDVEAAEKAGVKGILIPKNTDIANVLAEIGIK
jgi:D-glycero-D-manno-heptose 1,7-bisphosphate phosphatase